MGEPSVTVTESLLAENRELRDRLAGMEQRNEAAAEALAAWAHRARAAEDRLAAAEDFIRRMVVAAVIHSGWRDEARAFLAGTETNDE